MSLDAEVIILGGGCAGLSMAVALAEHAPHLRVLTLEKREVYTRDRTWCFWNTTDHPFRAAITHEWSEWRVRTEGHEARQRSERYRYQHLPADRFYALAQERIAAATQQELVLGSEIDGVRSADGLHEVELAGRTLRSRWLFDARTPAPGTGAPVFWQRFLGWHVQTEQPCFNPDCVELMDFESSAVPGRVVFFYTLPFSRTEALVEVTYLDVAGLAPEDGHQRLADRLRRLCPNGQYRILYREQGALPMGGAVPEPSSVGGAFPLGTRGGRVKPSSGYAFQRIQRQSRVLAQALGRGEPLPARVEPRLYGTLDRIFLSALRRHPERTPGYFLRLFRHVAPELLVPFLSETASAQAIVSTMWALPKRDFMAAALLPERVVTS